MRSKLSYFLLALIIGTVFFLGLRNISKTEYINQGYVYASVPVQWKETIASSINKKNIELYIDGNSINTKGNKIYMNESLTLMIPYQSIRDWFDCAVNLYDEKEIVIEKGKKEIHLFLGSDEMRIDKGIYTLSSDVLGEGDTIFVPLDAIINGLGYTYSWDMEKNNGVLINDSPESRTIPYYYDYRAKDKVSTVKNQGPYGTCWAFAALTALETSLLPEKNYNFSPDNMSLANSFNLKQNEGGEYAMAVAYLTSWQGPVLESEDPYGDGETKTDLKETVHVQEVQIVDSKDYEAIKELVYKYGGVQSSIYASITYSSDYSKYYNRDTYSYCYIGESKPNHDVVIIGWDDNYPKENFKADIESDGAFICQNSWGTDFGDEGVFYISYYDSNIGMHNVVYTRVDDTENYDNIYQSDLCGMVGYLGIEKEYASFANVYKANNSELLRAVGFYATGIDTSYNIYVYTNFEDVSSLNGEKVLVASGRFENAGYYTVDFDTPINLMKNKKYAVMVEINTPNSLKPVAVEYVSDYRTETVDLSDGEGYILLGYENWINTESADQLKCNICLKAYTDTVVEQNNIMEN